MKIFVFCLFAIIISLIIFLKGFFPLKIVTKNHAKSIISLENNVTRSYKHLVLMIIDALRADFAFGEYNFFPKTKNLFINGHGMQFTAEMKPPTVTLPRIKAMVTGSTPSFIDIALNFAATALEEDSIIMQFKKENRKMVFFGDDTWLKLFPDHFDRSDGTTSFYVQDYTEVDNNVTRHLSSELNNPDWDLMILHYLGLDHIGHVSGPKSPLVQPKLAEMDKIIYQIYSAMEKWKEPSLLVICGDHGMSDQGGHGGGSLAEIIVPVLFLSPQFSLAKGFQHTEMISQTDLCPTLSVLLGLPIPYNNIGQVIVDVLYDYSAADKLIVLHYNAQQVAQVFVQYVTHFEKESSYIMYMMCEQRYVAWKLSSSHTDHWKEECSSLMHLYAECLTSMAQKIQMLSTQYDNYSLAVSIVVLWMLFAVMAVSLMRKSQVSRCVSLSAYASQVFVVLGSLLLSHIVMCTGTSSSELMCRSSYLSISVQVVVAVIFTSCSVYLFNELPNCDWSLLMNCGMKFDLIKMMLVGGTILHVFSYLSSSFIEEEHQTFYFLTMSFHLLLLAQLILHSFISSTKENKEICYTFQPSDSLNIKYCDTKINSSQNSVIIQNHSEKNEVGGNRMTLYQLAVTKDLAVMLCNVALVVIILRVLRRWNQTGNKWLDVSDFADWLVLPENKLYLSMCVLLSFIIIGGIKKYQVKSVQSMFINLSLTTIYFYHVAQGHLFFPKATFLSHRGIIEAKSSFFLIGVTLLLSLMPDVFFQLEQKSTRNCVNYKSIRASDGKSSKIKVLKNSPAQGQNTSLQKKDEHHASSEEGISLHQRLNCISSVFLCYLCLVSRSHNIPVVAMLALTELLTTPVITKMSLELPYILIYCQWMGQAFFFFQGNSNSLSTLDLTAGYTGLTEFIPFITGCHICLLTYSGTIFWSLTFLKIICSMIPEKKDIQLFPVTRLSSVVSKSGVVYLLSLSLRAAVYTVLIVFQRHHLFIWTVFSPKLLYEFTYIIIVSLFLLIIIIFSHWY